MKHQYKLLSIMLACGLMTACSSDEPGSLATPVAAQFSAQIGDVASRASGTSWTSGDRIGISDNSGAFTNVPYTTAGDGVFTPAGTDRIFYNSTDPVTFTAYYPFNSDGGIITASVADQSKQTEFDFLWAQATGNYADPDVRFNFRHCMSRLSLTFTNSGNVDLSDLKFTIGGLALEGTFDVATGEAAVSADAVATELSVTPSEATADRAVSSVILFPQTPTDATISITAEGSEFISALPITELRSGTNYRLAVKVSATGIEVSELNNSEWTDGGSENVAVKNVLAMYSAGDVKKGDYLYKDGTVSDGGLRKIFTDGELKYEPVQPRDDPDNPVVGIVFWTPSETVADGRQTPASLTDDKIMSADYPGCTHGLAIAVKALTYDGSQLMVWQPSGSYEYVKVWQAGQNEYKPGATDFVSVASKRGATDNINRIYGYQNTLVLRAYNAYCLNTTDKSNYIVQSVAALDQFVNSGACPAPSNSTGWFLPSTKELHMLCYMDVDNVYSQEGTDKTATRDIVNSSLAAVGGDELKSNDTPNYWSSSEREEYIVCAFHVIFSSAHVSGSLEKFNTYRARAVCAF